MPAPLPPDAASTHLTWRATLWLVAAVSLLRLLYLVFFCPYELVADEAQYWDWSRRLDLCYYSKGPGIAWLIAASTRFLGAAEWTVRLPAVLCGAAAALVTARLAMRLAGGDSRAGFFAAALFLLIPAYQATSLLMTIDAPFLACWALALLAASHLTAALHRRRDRWESVAAGNPPDIGRGRSVLGRGLALGLALGMGMLFKYTMLLFLPGLIVFLVLRRQWLSWNRPAAAGAVLMLATVVTCAIPVAVWNHRHGWPTYRHLLGNLELPGGDRDLAAAPGAAMSAPAPNIPSRPSSWIRRLLHPLEFIGTQLALVGPGMVLLALGLRQSWVERWRDGSIWSQQCLLICVSGSVLLFYAGISLGHRVQGNWPIAAYVGLVALAGALLPRELSRYQLLVKQWRQSLQRPRPRMGWLRRQPETPAQIAWHWAIAYGLLAGAGMTALLPLSQLPGMNRVIPVHRFMSSRPLVAMVQRGMDNAGLTFQQNPLFLAESYGETALLAFYLPGRPVVHSAASYLGSRKSSYDYFADTDLTDPAIVGRPAVFVTADRGPWERAFGFAQLRQVEPPPGLASSGQASGTKPPRRVFAARQYLGPMSRTDEFFP